MRKTVEITLHSYWSRFKAIREIKKEHRNVKVLNKSKTVVEHGYKGVSTSYYKAVIEYEE